MLMLRHLPPARAPGLGQRTRRPDLKFRPFMRDVSFEPTLAWAGGAQVGRTVVGFEAWMRPDLDLCVRPRAHGVVGKIQCFQRLLHALVHV